MPAHHIWVAHIFLSRQGLLGCCAFSSPFQHISPIPGFEVHASRNICWIMRDGLAPWCSIAFSLHFWTPGVRVWWWLHSPPVNSFWNVFITGCYPHTKANDLSKSLSHWHTSHRVCILRDKFNQWTHRPNSFRMMRFCDMLDPVLHKCTTKLNSLGNAVLATSANRVKTTLACMAFQGHASQEWVKEKHGRDLLKIRVNSCFLNCWKYCAILERERGDEAELPTHIIQWEECQQVAAVSCTVAYLWHQTESSQQKSQMVFHLITLPTVKERLAMDLSVVWGRCKFWWRTEQRTKWLFSSHPLILLSSLAAWPEPCVLLLHACWAPDALPGCTPWLVGRRVMQGHHRQSCSRGPCYPNASWLQGYCSWSCKGESLRRNKINLATCEFRRDV